MSHKNTKIILHFLTDVIENLCENDVNATIIITGNNDTEIYGYAGTLPPEKLNKLLADYKL